MSLKRRKKACWKLFSLYWYFSKKEEKGALKNQKIMWKNGRGKRRVDVFHFFWTGGKRRVGKLNCILKSGKRRAAKFQFKKRRVLTILKYTPFSSHPESDGNCQRFGFTKHFFLRENFRIFSHCDCHYFRHFVKCPLHCYYLSHHFLFSCYNIHSLFSYF